MPMPDPTPADAPAADPAPDAPQRQLIGSRAELAAAVLQLIGRARRSLRCASADGQIFGLGAPAVVGACEALLRAQRAATVRVLVDDAGWLETGAPRLKALQRRLPHALTLRQASADDAVGLDLHLIGDERDCLSVKAGRLVSGEMWLAHQPRARLMLAEFDRRWAAAAHDLPVTPLGL